MSEQAARQTFRDKLLRVYPNAHYQRLEDRFHSGIPDINLCIPGVGEYWIEAKHIRSLPTFKNTPIRVEFRKEQLIWLEDRKAAGGSCLALVRIASQAWAVYDGHFRQLEEGVSLAELMSLSVWYGEVLDVPAIFERLLHDPRTAATRNQ